jgi:hypothetical protein
MNFGNKQISAPSKDLKDMRGQLSALTKKIGRQTSRGQLSWSAAGGRGGQISGYRFKTIATLTLKYEIAEYNITVTVIYIAVLIKIHFIPTISIIVLAVINLTNM